MRFTHSRWVLVALAVFAAACGGEDSQQQTTGDTNTAPVITGTPAKSVMQDAAYTFVPTASDADGDPLIFGIDAKPAWAAFDAASGRLSGRPTVNDVGVYRGIVIRVSDGKSDTLMPAFDLTVVAAVGNANRAPIIAGTPAASVVAGSTYTFTPMASDADGDTLTFSIRNRPAWAMFSPANGQLQGTPQVGSVGSFDNIVISVSDGHSTVAMNAFSILVTAPNGNSAPVISGVPMMSVEAGTPYAFVPTASDADNDTLTFSVSGLPSWASFDPQTGRLAGTPPANTTGTFGNIVISVSDGFASASLPAFAITVTAPTTNKPPTITGSPPPSALQDTQYSFTPTASDPNGDTLAFSITNKPSWAAFDTATGRLQGTPGAGDVGTTTGIVITVSDGQASASLAAFSITVQAVATGSATLTWTPPTQNEDGSPLTDLAGYKIYWGTTQGSYPNSATLNNPGLTSYVVENLLSGNTYFFVTTAFNSGGIESQRSNVASKTIP